MIENDRDHVIGECRMFRLLQLCSLCNLRFPQSELRIRERFSLDFSGK